jgi:NifU-like protein involved in Fe-S cluster formation/bacterioferritin-associated ferredoxin
MEEWTYSNIVQDHFMNPRNVLTVPEEEFKADGVGMVGSPSCGDMMKVWIKVEGDKIVDFKWKTFGCASAIGSTSMLSVMITENGGMKIDEAYAITPDAIMERLGGLPKNKIHCSVLGDKALREAIDAYYEKNNQGEKIVKKRGVLVCECLDVYDEEIKEAVLEDAHTWEELQARTKVATGCGQCKDEARALFVQYMEEYFPSKAKKFKFES